jgi:hypothetical protein
VTCVRTSILGQLTFSCGRPPLTLPFACFETTLINLSLYVAARMMVMPQIQHLLLISTDAQIPNQGPRPHTCTNVHQYQAPSNTLIIHQISEVTHKNSCPTNIFTQYCPPIPDSPPPDPHMTSPSHHVNPMDKCSCARPTSSVAPWPQPYRMIPSSLYGMG